MEIVCCNAQNALLCDITILNSKEINKERKQCFPDVVSIMLLCNILCTEPIQFLVLFLFRNCSSIIGNHLPSSQRFAISNLF